MAHQFITCSTILSTNLSNFQFRLVITSTHESFVLRTSRLVITSTHESFVLRTSRHFELYTRSFINRCLFNCGVSQWGESKIHCKNGGIHHAPRPCPAFKTKCKKCIKYNHFAKVCRLLGTGNVQKRSQSQVWYVYRSTRNHRKCWTKAFFINGSAVNCKLDSGTEANVSNSV